MIGNRRDAMSPFAAAGRDPDLELLLSPAHFYTHPQDVLDDPQASLEEKRTVLAAWASDACAVESMPALRQAPGSPVPVAFDAIMEALQRLDRLARAGTDIVTVSRRKPEYRKASMKESPSPLQSGAAP